MASGSPLMHAGETIYKLAGVVCGALLSLVFLPPKSVAAFLRRTIAAIIFGFVFGHIALSLMLQLTGGARTAENIVAAWAIAAFSSWIVMGHYLRYLKRKSDCA